MARLFQAASNEYLEVASAPITAAPFTVALWAKTVTSDSSDALWSLSDSGRSNHQWALMVRSDQTMDFSCRAGSGFQNATGSGTFSDGTWFHVAGIAESASSRRCRLNGVSGSANTSTVTPTSIDTTSIGQLGDSSNSSWADAHIAECGMWDVALTAAEVQQLSDGASPLLVRPQSLIAYWPIFGTQDPEPDLVGGLGMTVGVTPLKSDHPRIYMPSQQIILPPGVTADGADADGEPAGAAIAGEAGTVTVTGDSNATAPSAAILGQAGTVTVETDVNVTLTGASIAGEAQAPTVTAEIFVDADAPTAAISGEAGTVTAVTPDLSVTLTGAESALQAGIVTVSAGISTTIQLGPHGLTHKAYGTFTRDVNVTLVGAQANAEAGVASPVVPSVLRQQLSPTVLATKIRQFSPKGLNDAIFSITGAQIQGQAAHPDSANTTIYTDSAESALGSGTVIADATADEVVSITGAEIAGEAGTALGTGSIEVDLTGAEITTQAGEVTGIGDVPNSVFVTITGAQIGTEAGTVTPTYGWSQEVTGAQINAQASDTGLDTNFDVSVTIEPATIKAEAGIITDVGDFPSVEGEGLKGRLKRKPRRRRKRRRYIIEIDKQFFEVASPEQAQALLTQAVEVAETQELVAPPVIKVTTGSGAPVTSPRVIIAEREAKRKARQAFQRQQAALDRQHEIDAEISRLLLSKIAQEQDEEEALLVLLF